MAAVNEKKRIELLDELRGAAIFCMVFYHAFYVAYAFFDWDAGKISFDFFMPVQPFFAWLFIMICGISSRLSHSNAKRGLLLLLIAAAISLVTALLLPALGIEDAEIYFGILHLLSVSILIFALIRPLADKINPSVGIVAGLILFSLTMGVESGYVGLPFLRLELPQVLYKSSLLFPFGMYGEGFNSIDYFPLLPNFFMFMTGTFIGVYVKNGMVAPWAYKKHIPFFASLGRHSLLIYVLHIPVTVVVFIIADIILERL